MPPPSDRTATQAAASAAGNIYDLGYRRYEGTRLGRRHAVFSLYLFSLRAAFGLGRRTSSKIIPIAIAILAAIPAAIQLGIAAIVSTGDISPIKPENYFSFISVTSALFCAAVAPEVIGRDQRTRTLPLYFSRALLRRDYVLAKLGALVTALLFLTLLPELILFLGNALASKDAGDFWQHNWPDLWRILVSGVLVAVLMSSLSLVIAAQTARRSYATVAVIAAFLITVVLSGTLVQGIGGSVARWAVFIAPFDVLEGATLWVFNVEPSGDSVVQASNFAGWVFFAWTIAVSAVCIGLLLRRYERISV
jgi:ABC-2 type transport system permease protein